MEKAKAKEEELRIIIEHPYSRGLPNYDWYQNPPPDDNFGALPQDDHWEDYVADSWRRVHEENERLQRQVEELTAAKDLELSRRIDTDKAFCDFRDQSAQLEAQLQSEKKEALAEVRRLQGILNQERTSRTKTIEDAIDETSFRLSRETDDLRLSLRRADKELEELRSACSGLRASLESAQAETHRWYEDCHAWEEQCKEWLKEREQMREELTNLTANFKETSEHLQRTERELERHQTEAQDSMLEFARLKEDNSRSQEQRLEAEKGQASATEELRKISLSWEQSSSENERLRKDTAMLGAKLRDLEEIAARSRMDLVREEQNTQRLREQLQDVEGSSQRVINELRHKHEAAVHEYDGLERTVGPLKSRKNGLICETSQLRTCNNLLRRELDVMRAENYELKLWHQSHPAGSISSTARNSKVGPICLPDMETDKHNRFLENGPLGEAAVNRAIENDVRRPASARATMPAHIPITTGEDSSWQRGVSGLRSRLNAERFKFEYHPPEAATQGGEKEVPPPRAYDSIPIRSPPRPRSAAR